MPVRAFDKKRTVVLLRSVVVISTSYLILFGNAVLSASSIAYILALILSNVLLTVTPARWFHHLRFSATLLLVDTAVVLLGLYLTVGCFSQDFLIIYFFTIFLTTATSSVAEIAVGAAMISGLYGYWLWLTAAHVLGAGEWLRLPFFFIVAVFYAYVTEETKQERYRREQAERESDRMRLLLELGDTVSRRVITHELVGNVGGLVEAAFPRLKCAVHLEPRAGAQQGTTFVLHSNGRTFGALDVGTTDGAAVTPEEIQFCKVVALVAGNAFYGAEQASAAQDPKQIKDEFLATVSHELRSPLHVILGNAEILEDVLSETTDPVARESIERLRANACRLLDLVEEMLCFAELRAGKGAVLKGSFDLRASFEQCEASMREQLAGRPIQFSWQIDERLQTVHTDGRKLQLIVNALLSNAAKFTERGFIRLSAEVGTHDQLEIIVEDSGIGINAVDLPRAFQEFRQLDGTLHRRFGGMGLGLSLAQELTSVLGGQMIVQSQPKQGSTFRVRLPIDARVARPCARSATAALPFTLADLLPSS